MRARGHARAARARTAAAAAAVCALLPLLLVLARAPAGARAAAAIPARDKSKAKASRGKPQAAARDGDEASGPAKGLAPCQWKDPETGAMRADVSSANTLIFMLRTGWCAGTCARPRTDALAMLQVGARVCVRTSAHCTGVRLLAGSDERVCRVRNEW